MARQDRRAVFGGFSVETTPMCFKTAMRQRIMTALTALPALKAFMACIASVDLDLQSQIFTH